MNISVLDCTLRDGGYCNQWKFGCKNIKKIIEGLMNANIDIIECGFISDKIIYDENISKFSEVGQIEPFIPKDRRGKLFVAMMNYGEFKAEDLPIRTENSIDGIRVAFHKEDRYAALRECEIIKKKGYLVFIQGMVSLSYSDEEFIDLIKKVNELEPYAFYIVDSFGQMKKKDLIRLIYMVEHNLKQDILIGFHSHNNMQLAYSNAQSLVDFHTKRNLIIDSSIYGMGRGAGNLNTELFVEYLNENANGKYELKPLLSVIDEILTYFYEKNFWGYSLPNYLSAKNNVHPNYADYLDSKKTLTVEGMDYIFSMMDSEKGYIFDKDYIEELYQKYMRSGELSEERFEELRNLINGRSILLIGPGKSGIEEKDKVDIFISLNNPLVFSINFDTNLYKSDYIFVSNLRRFREIDQTKHYKCICTSNIPSVDVYMKMDYKTLINDEEIVSDNAGMMLIALLIKMKVNKIYLAGMDGYSIVPNENFSNDEMSFYAQKGYFEAMNRGMEKVIRNYQKEMEICFLTGPKYLSIRENTND